MIRLTLAELREWAERARFEGRTVDLDPVTVRSLVDATAALVRLAELPRIATGQGDVVDVEQVRRFVAAVQSELDLAGDVARARFVDEHVEPTIDTTIGLRRVERELGPSDRERLDAELAELGRAWRRLVDVVMFRRRRRTVKR